MTAENRLLIERAIGLLEGVSFVAGEGASAGITCAVEMLDAALKQEENND
jgi:hypothetical protein